MARRFVILAIVALSLGGPLAELFDRWDQTQQTGDDTELTVVVSALCVGVAFAIGEMVIVGRTRTRHSGSRTDAFVPRVIVCQAVLIAPIPASSPPTVLRV